MKLFRHTAFDSAQKGSVLIMVLWVMAAMSMLALSFSVSIRTEVNAARNVVDQKESYYLARAGVEYVIYKVIEAQTAFARIQQRREGDLQSVPPVLTGYIDLPLSRGGARVQIIDETGKLNVNGAPGYLLYNLFIMVGLEEWHADMLADSIEDWRDPDDLHRLNGAESDYYQALDIPYFAKNGLFDVPEELLLVKGVTPDIYYGRKGMTPGGEPVEYYALQKYLTTFTTMNRINVNSAPSPVLAAIPGLDFDTAAEIQRMRQEAPIMNVSEIMEKIPGVTTEASQLLSTVRSNVYTLVSDGYLSDSELIGRIRCVVRVDASSPKGYSVLYWNESNIEL